MGDAHCSFIVHTSTQTCSTLAYFWLNCVSLLFISSFNQSFLCFFFFSFFWFFFFVFFYLHLAFYMQWCWLSAKANWPDIMPCSKHGNWRSVLNPWVRSVADTIMASLTCKNMQCNESDKSNGQPNHSSSLMKVGSALHSLFLCARKLFFLFSAMFPQKPMNDVCAQSKLHHPPQNVKQQQQKTVRTLIKTAFVLQQIVYVHTMIFL